MKENFGIDNSSISAYSNQLDTDIIQKEFKTAKSIELFSKKMVDGIGTHKLNIATPSVYWQDTACSLASSGGTAFLQRDLVVTPISVRESLCKADFYDYWTTYVMNAKLTDSAGSIGEVIVKSYMAQVEEDKEVAIWQAVDGGDNYYDKFDGVIEIVSGASCVNVVAASGMTIDTIDDDVVAMADAIPVAVKQNTQLRLYIGTAEYDLLVRKWAGTFIYTGGMSVDANTYEMKYPYRNNLTIIGVDGLSGTKKMILTTDDNIYFPNYGGNKEVINIESVIDPITDLHWWKYDFIMGVQVGLPANVITNFATA